jgi:hypothetical protein
LKGCGAAVTSAVAGAAIAADPPPAERPRVALVFIANSAEREIWPYPDFDCPARQREILKLLGEGCPQVEFVPVVLTGPADVQKALDLKDRVDGYLVYAITLTWSLTGSIVQIGKLGKPTLVVDEYLGGSGVFLVGYSTLCRAGIPAGAVSSTRPEDLVALARLFADVKKPGATAASFAKRCEEVYRRTFAAPSTGRCTEDQPKLTEIGECVKRLSKSKFLIVGAGPSGQVHNFLGVQGVYVGFAEFKALYDKVDRDRAAEWAKQWSKRADKVVEPTAEWIRNAGGVYLAMLDLLKQHGTDSITMNCLGGFGSGQLPAYPCLGFMQLLDDGSQGVCEAMPDDSVSMLMARVLTGRPGLVSDPVVDTAKNQIVYSHCMAMTKVFGPQTDPCKFRIRTLHNRDPRGCCAQSFLPEGFLTTTFRTNVAQKLLVVHQAKTVANLDSDRGCRTQLVGEVRGDVGKLLHEWDRFGWHRVTVYGDLVEPMSELGKALGLTVVKEA